MSVTLLVNYEKNRQFINVSDIQLNILKKSAEIISQLNVVRSIELCFDVEEESELKTEDVTEEKLCSDVAEGISPVNCTNPMYIKGKYYPCGHCIGCRSGMSKKKIRHTKKA